MKLGYVIIYVNDVSEAVDFYERAFDADCDFIHESGQFAQMKTGETKLAFTSHELGATAVPVEYVHSDPAKPPAGFEFTLVVEDVASAYQRAVAAGAAALAEPHDTPWGQTVSYVRDHVGTLVGIASPM